MLYHIKKLISDCLTGQDGKTYDVARVSLIGAITVFMFLSCWSVLKNKQEWKPDVYGIGFGAVIAGAGIGIGMKAKTEPKGDS